MSIDPSPIVTLTTDFGTRDGYVAAMKGVILAEAPSARIVDISHEIPPQDVRAGAWVLAQAAPFFPAGTVHVAVVDPGVGTERAAVVVEIDGHSFIAPDNGLLSWVMKRADDCRPRAIRPEIHRPGPLSDTFHGRDIFAYVAGLLCGGKATVETVSEAVTGIEVAPWTQARVGEQEIKGEVVRIDRFGNVITNIARADLDTTGWGAVVVHAGKAWEFRAIERTYGEHQPGALITLWGSSDTLEIAEVNGSAAGRTGLQPGDPVKVSPS